MRLTKEELEHYRNTYDRFDGVESNIFEEICNELIEYKDIEEELGIDLITLFKALSYGVFLKNGNRVEHHFVFLCKDSGSWALGYEYSTKYGLQGWCLETKKYKQHWALTKEELENDK